MLEDLRLKKGMDKYQKLMILSPVVMDKKGEFTHLFTNLIAKGYSEVRIDGTVKKIHDDFVLIKTNRHNIEVVCDRITAENEPHLDKRLSSSIENALKLSEGLVIVAQVLDKSFTFPEYPKDLVDTIYSEKFSCPVDNIQISEIEPRNSANGPSTILTASPSENVVLNLGASMVINFWIEETSDSGKGVGLLDMPTKLVMPGVVLTASQVASSITILIKM